MKNINAATHLILETVVYSVKLYSYQTGCFTIKDKKGVKYVFILSYYDANTIFPDLLKSRSGKNTFHAYNTFHDYLKKTLFNTKIQWLDNEASNSLKQYNQN